MSCCDVCTGSCVAETSGADCPNSSPTTDCSDVGTSDAGGSAAIEARFPACPGAMERCSSEVCLAGQPCVACPTGKVCLQLDLSCGPAGGSTAQCIDDPCRGSPLDCACADWVCAAADPSGILSSCGVYPEGHFLLGPDDAPFMFCGGGGVCAAPSTPIATPLGDVPIALLKAGDLVYSMHDQQITAVPLLAVTRRPVRGHRVVRVVLEDGTALQISAPHPLAGGRPFGALEAGETLDGHRVVSTEVVDYAEPYTHDILPASDSGAYQAGGLWLGSTL